MKNGFTLIELLVTIAVLGMIAVIAIPQVGNIIEKSKEDAYLETKKNIESAAHLYRIRNSHEFPDEVGKRGVVTVKQLQEAGLLSYNIVDQRTGSKIVNRDVIVELLSSGEYDYELYNSEYNMDNIILWYDGLYRGSDNSVWIDRAGIGYNGTLMNFNFGVNSGWRNNHLQFDATTDYLRTGPLGTINGSLTFEMFFIRTSSGDITWTNGANSIIVYSSGNTYIQSNTGTASNGATYTITNGIPYLLSIVYNTQTLRGRYYLNGNFIREVNLPASSATFALGTGQNIFASHSGANRSSGNLYSVRFYNKALTDDEIKQNYEVDKERFNF
jgi:prepilin-type N-terminal cleavage/methylation domain-containing protein